MDLRKLAVHINNFRVVPRLLTIGYGLVMVQSWMWFQSLPAPTTQQVTFISTISGMAAVIFSFYVNTGKVQDPEK